VLLLGALLAQDGLTVASVLRITGLSRERHVVNDHRAPARVALCPRAGARILLGVLVDAFVPSGPNVMAVDDTVERRRHSPHAGAWHIARPRAIVGHGTSSSRAGCAP
jgi:hypothetical protein